MLGCKGLTKQTADENVYYFHINEVHVVTIETKQMSFRLFYLFVISVHSNFLISLVSQGGCD